MKDQRTAPRFGPLVIKAWMDEEGSKREGYLINVSLGGAFFAAEHLPQNGADVALRADMPWRMGELRARARVVWTNGSRRAAANASSVSGVGLAFTRLEPGSKELLDGYLARFAEIAAEIEKG